MCGLREAVDVEGRKLGYIFECPGCGSLHLIYTEKRNQLGAVWEFNGDLEKPTFSPSVRARWREGGRDIVCHFFIRAGRIEFCSDSTHALSGKTVSLPRCEAD